MTEIACTIASARHRGAAEVLARSVGVAQPGIRRVLLLADRPDARNAEASAFDEVLTLDDVAPAEFMTFRHSEQDLSYAMTPFLLEHLIDRGEKRVIFLKQETKVFGSLAPVFRRLAEAPLFLTPHLTSPPATSVIERELNVLQSGLFNVGLLGVAASPSTRSFLRWWAERVSIDCRHDVPGGVHHEQRWLDFAPSFVCDAFITRERHINVGHWALPDIGVHLIDGTPHVEAEQVIAFRFSGFDPYEHPSEPTRYSPRLSRKALGDVMEIFDTYAQEVRAATGPTRSEYGFDRFEDGARIPSIARRLHRELGSRATSYGDPSRVGPDTFRASLSLRIDGIPRIWSATYDRRPDLQRAFPDLARVDRERFREWCHTFGQMELELDQALAEELAW